jgi:hypothetical protein
MIRILYKREGKTPAYQIDGDDLPKEFENIGEALIYLNDWHNDQQTVEQWANEGIFFVDATEQVEDGKDLV